MNTLTIPPSPNWYEASILGCAPDNTLVYGARNDIVVIQDLQKDKPADVRIIPKAHSQKIISINLNKNWGQPNKYLVTVGDDKVVKLWNLETFEKKLSHSIHKIHTKVIGATFAGDERIISVSEEGAIVVLNVGLNQPNLLKDIFSFKVTVTCLSTCPHANWLTAFGLKNGLVVVADLRKQGKVLYKLRGHDKPVVSLAWCPVPVNIFPKDPHNFVGLKKGNAETRAAVSTELTENVESTDNFIGLKKDDPTVLEVSTDLTENVESTDNFIGLKKDDPTVPEVSTELTENVESTDNFIGLKKDDPTVPEVSTELTENVESIDTTVYCSTNKPKKNNSIWTDLKHADDDELPKEYKDEEKTHPLLKIYESDDDNFLKECQKLKEQILGEDTPKKDDNEVVTEEKQDRPILKAKKSSKVKRSSRGKGGENEKREEPEKDEKSDKVVEEERKGESDEDKTLDENKTETSEYKENEASSGEVDANASKIGGEEEKDDEVTSSETKREIPPNIPLEEEPRKEFLLASSAKEGHIYIWRAGTDGRMQTFLTSPSKNNHRRSSKTGPDKVWITLCWISPNILLSSSKNGELLHWTLPKPKDKSKQFRLVHNDHNGLLFSISGPIAILNENNWLDVDEKKLNAWTVGQDRLLLNTSLSSERTNLCCYPTVGVVECFAPCPLDPSRLAIGTGEGIIKIWDLSRPHVKNIVMTNFYQKIQSKVTTLAWHPVLEVQLAYGTMEGRIGYFDVNNKSKSPTLLPNFFKSQVHKIEWGPINGNVDELGLFAVAEGKLIAFSCGKSENPIEVDTPDNTFVYTFSWKPDFKMLLVASKTGVIIVYSSDLKIISTLYRQCKLQSICWHPDAIHCDSNVSKYYCTFASIFNSKEIAVYDCGIESDNNDEKIVVKLKARDTINSISWNPFVDNQLVVGSDDGLAQVWNVEDGSVLATYVNPNFESVLAVTWSPIEAGYVISAGKDHTLRIWEVAEYPAQTDKDISELMTKCVKDIPEEATEVAPKAEKPHEEPPKPKKLNKNNLLPKFYNPKNNSEVIADLRKLLKWKENSNDLVESQIEDEPSLVHIFGSNEDMLKLIQANELSHKTRGKCHLNNILSLFKGDISTAVKEAIDEKRVTPWIITMAPMASPKLWKTACEVYAHQLSEESDSDPLEIATYYLACHKIEEAVNALCEGALFREALALAKCRLPSNDPLVTKVIEKWASYSLIVGNFEVAAQCNIFLGKYEEAASVLFRRSDVQTLEFATELAEKSGNEELHKAVLFRCNAFKNDGKKVNGELSNIEVVPEKRNEETCDQKDENTAKKREEMQNGKMSTSLHDEGLNSTEETSDRCHIRRSSSLGDNFRLSFDEMDDQENGSEQKRLENGGGDNDILA